MSFFFFFLNIKGCPRKQRRQESIDISTLVGLYAQLDTKVKHLSDAMKRRLSTAMAFTGAPKVSTHSCAYSRYNYVREMMCHIVVGGNS